MAMDNKTLGMILALGGGGGGGASALTDLSDVSVSSPSNGQALKYNSSTNKWENSNDVGAVIDDSTTSATKVWSSNKVNTELGKKEDAFTIVSGTLTAGQTSITLNSEAITANSNIMVFTSPNEIYHSAMVATTGSVTVTFDAQASDVSVRVVIF